MTPNIFNHHWFSERIAAYLTGGLDADEIASFEAHAAECASCAAELAAARNDDAMMLELFDRIGPSPDFEDRVIQRLRAEEPAKMRLLSSFVPHSPAPGTPGEGRGGGFANHRLSLRVHPMLIRAAKVTAAAVFLAGLGYGGLMMMDQRSQRVPSATKDVSILDDVPVASSAATPTTQPSANTGDWEAALSGKRRVKDSGRLGDVRAPGQNSSRFFLDYSSNATIPGVSPNQDSDGDGVADSHFDFQRNPFPSISGGNSYNKTGWTAGVRQPNLPGYDISPNSSGGVGIGSPFPTGGAFPGGRVVPQVANDSVLLKTDLPADGPGGQRRVEEQNDLTIAAGREHRADDQRNFQFGSSASSGLPGPSVDYYRPTDTGKTREQLMQQKVKDLQQQRQKELSLSMDNERQNVNIELRNSVVAQNTVPNPGTETVPAETPAPTPPPPAPQTPSTSESPDASRKIIRDGEMSFQVDSFDSAFLQITKIAAEEGGFVADTQSEKLTNGKMSGTITVRVPPDHLDTLTLKLRALGDLTGQKISAQDVTKEYTDLQSELRAAKAMEDRLLEIIKTGSGQVKDLVAAEREVGVWREKVEKVTGEINYYNSLISLSTLRLTLEERDIRRASLATEKETVDMGIETPDVEKARADAMHTLDDAKARIIQADLKKLDAGQLAATIVADVSPDAAGPVIDHFKQLGRVARLNINRQQTVAEGATVTPGIKVDRRDTRLQISLYNLANVSPRQTTNLTMACPDVETAYHTIIANVYEAGGRVVDSALNRVKPDQTDGTITFETPREKADSVLAAIRTLGEVMHLNLTENPDAANVTTAKQGFALTLASQTMIPARESISTTLMPAGEVASAYHAIIDAVQKNHGNITTAQLQEQNSQSDSATLIFDISRDAQPAIEKTIADAIGATGRVIARQSNRSNDTEHTLDSKVQFTITFCSASALQARELVARVLAVEDVGGFYSQLLGAAQQAGAKVLTATEDQSNPSNPSGQLDFLIARSQAGAIEKLVSEAKGGVISRSVSRSADMNSTTDEKFDLRFAIGALSQLPPRQTTTIGLDASDPESASAALQAVVLSDGGRVVEQHLLKDDKYQAHLVVQVPLSKGSDFLGEVRDAGSIQTIERTEDQTIPAADFAQAKFDLTLNATSAVVGPQAGLWAGLKSSLGASIRGLAFSFELIVIGICLALPWAILGYLGWRGAKRLRKKFPPKVSPQTSAS